MSSLDSKTQRLKQIFSQTEAELSGYINGQYKINRVLFLFFAFFLFINYVKLCQQSPRIKHKRRNTHNVWVIIPCCWLWQGKVNICIMRKNVKLSHALCWWRKPDSTTQSEPFPLLRSNHTARWRPLASRTAQYFDLSDECGPWGDSESVAPQGRTLSSLCALTVKSWKSATWCFHQRHNPLCNHCHRTAMMQVCLSPPILLITITLCTMRTTINQAQAPGDA